MKSTSTAAKTNAGLAASESGGAGREEHESNETKQNGLSRWQEADTTYDTQFAQMDLLLSVRDVLGRYLRWVL